MDRSCAEDIVTTRSLVAIDARSSRWEERPWPSAFELARILPPSSWTLVGGLMVKMHAELASLPAPRTTTDVDSALHLETQAVTFAQACALLTAAGYDLDEDTRHAYRFGRGQDQIDIMCSDRQSIWKRHRFRGRPLYGIPGGTRALQQTIDLDLQTNIDTVRLVIPSLRGALVLKGAAYLDDPRNRVRHAEDAVVLLACLENSSDAWVGLSQRSRRRVRTLVRALSEQSAPWVSHDPVVQSLARESLEELVLLSDK